MRFSCVVGREEVFQSGLDIPQAAGASTGSVINRGRFRVTRAYQGSKPSALRTFPISAVLRLVNM
jgi:hypothetical protein